MQFNSWLFILFLVFVWTAHRVGGGAAYRNAVLLVASYTFYGSWDWRFLGLIWLSTVTDFVAGRLIYAEERESRRRVWLAVSITVNLAILGFFKYFNFFADGLHTLLSDIGLPLDRVFLDVVLPVGISFYTFQTLSYSIDIYRRQLEPDSSLLNFAVFVAFFPQLVAGPIERARNLLPQLRVAKDATKDQLVLGLSLIAIGLVKKVVIADNLAGIVDPLYASSAELSVAETYLATLAFAFQILADFSAYTDIARGSAKCLGIELIENFKNPYAALNPQDFWRRWHISLSTWLRDYLYIGVGGNRGGARKTYRNLMITMVLGGLWHGAAWNFLWWGIYHGALLCGHRLLSGSLGWRIPKPFAWFAMFHFTLVGWTIFRSTRTVLVDGVPDDRSGAQLLELLGSYQNGWFSGDIGPLALQIAGFGLPLVFLEAWRRDDRRLAALARRPILAPILTAALAFAALRWGVQDATAFIYFQF